MFSFLISFDSTQNYDFNFKGRKLSIIELPGLNLDSIYPQVVIEHLQFLIYLFSNLLRFYLHVTKVCDF